MRGMYVVCTMHVLVVCNTGFLARYSRVPLYELRVLLGILHSDCLPCILA